ncbi:MAG: hypothetical protein EAZ99_01260 [Alphaproteobacteria bacterium]|nr:MAG: hypothetical protein EAZ99_01260 [Alphaproteobacteria bacterium]
MRSGATRNRWVMMGLVAVLALAPALAEAKARAGSGGSAGSRGARTTESAPATSVAPTAAPVQRSATPATASPATAARPGAAAAQPSWAQRNPFMAGMLGGLVGAGLIGMFMGAGLFSGLGSLAGILGFLLQAALIAGLVFLVIRLFRRRSPAQQPAMAAAYAGMPQGRSGATGPLAGVQFPGGLGGGSAAPAGGRDELGLQPADFDAFEEVLGRVQMAWSAGDRAALARVTTPEMASYFGEELDRMAALGHVNHIADGKLINGDVAEAWREGAREYATVAMRWSARDWTEDRMGRVIEGNREQATETLEVWTFLRVTGGAWVLSAVQQVD